MKIKRQKYQVSLLLTLIVSFLVIFGCEGVNTQQDGKQGSINNQSNHAKTVKGENSNQNKLNDSDEVHKQDPPQRPKVRLLGQDDNPMRIPTKIEFSNGTIIDVREADPYGELPYKLLKNVEGGLQRLYDLSDMSESSKKEVLMDARINEDAFQDGDYLRMFTKNPIIESKNGITVVSYHASYYSSSEDILATQGEALIYDSKGNLMHQISDKKDGFYGIRLSEDGRYLMQRYGRSYGEDGGGQLDTGFKFYDTNTGEMVFEYSLGKKDLINYDFFGGSNYVHLYRTEGKFFIKYFIDISGKSVYQKYMNRKKYFNDSKYKSTIHPLFSKTKQIEDLIKDGFKKIEL